MNKMMLRVGGIVVGGLVATLMIVLETAPAMQGKVAKVAANR